MAAPATDNWQAVQDTAVAIGSISDAARQHGVSIAAACQRAKRESWPVGRRPAKALAAAREAHSAAVVAAGGVRSVTSTEAMASELAELRDSGTLSAARAAAVSLRGAASAGVPILTASDLLAAVKAHRSAHGLDRDGVGSAAPGIAIQVNIG